QRQTVVRRVVGFKVVVGQRRPRRGIEAEGDRRRHTPAADLDAIATGDVSLVLEQIQTAGNVVAEHAIDVEGVTTRLVRTVGEAGVTEILLLGRLADQVQAAAGGASPGIGRAWPLADFELLDVE